jgi:hypothetical protein
LVTISRQTKQQAEALKAAIFRTFNELQEDGQPHSLIAWARANPGAFYTSVLPRILPKPVEISASEGVSFALVYQVGEKQVDALPDPDVIEVECNPCTVGREPEPGEPHE